MTISSSSSSSLISFQDRHNNEKTWMLFLNERETWSTITLIFFVDRSESKNYITSNIHKHNYGMCCSSSIMTSIRPINRLSIEFFFLLFSIIIVRSHHRILIKKKKKWICISIYKKRFDLTFDKRFKIFFVIVI